MNHTQRLSSAENGIAMCFKTISDEWASKTYGISLTEAAAIRRRNEIEALRNRPESEVEAA